MMQERSYSCVIFFGNTIFSEYLKKENMAFRAVLINHLNRINNWAFQQKVNFNPDLNK